MTGRGHLGSVAVIFMARSTHHVALEQQIFCLSPTHPQVPIRCSIHRDKVNQYSYEGVLLDRMVFIASV